MDANDPTGDVPEEELLAIIEPPRYHFSGGRLMWVMLLSFAILGGYLLANRIVYPGYPVVTPGADADAAFSAVYPPLRPGEAPVAAQTQAIIAGKAPGIPLISFAPLFNAPFALLYGDIGISYTTSFFLWGSAMVFCGLAVQWVRFPVAVVFTLLLAFGSPNLFFALGGFPAAQAQFFLLVMFLALEYLAAARHVRLMGALCGFASGMAFWVMPVLALLIPVFAMAIYAVRIPGSKSDHGLQWYLGSTGLTLLAGGILLERVSGTMPVPLATVIGLMTPSGLISFIRSIVSVFGGLPATLVSRPESLIIMVPAALAAPLGMRTLWRDGYQMHTLVLGTSMLLLIGAAAATAPSTRETIIAPALLPLIPLLLVCIAMLWEDTAAGRATAMILVAATVFQCTLAWWLVPPRDPAFRFGVRQDRDARAVLLSRSDGFSRMFSSSRDQVRVFRKSIARADLHGWLSTLDQPSREAVRGHERAMFESLVTRVREGGLAVDSLIGATDPNQGIHLVIEAFADTVVGPPDSSGSMAEPDSGGR